MPCPHCGNDVPAEPIVAPLTICPTCLRTLVISGGGCALASGAETTGLSVQDLTTFRSARKRLREARG